jgi:hypothetical protein
VGTDATPSSTGGDARKVLDRPPGDRYRATGLTASASGGLAGIRAPLAIVAGAALAFTILGGVLAITAGLIVVATLTGWLVGLVVRPPLRAALVAVGAVAAGLLGIWLFGRWEGGVLDPLEYLAEVQGIAVPLEFLAAAGMAAAASR